MKNRKAADVVLGVNVTQQLIEAVLLQQVEDRVQVLHRFVRQRAHAQEFSTTRSLAKALPGLMEDATDYSIDLGSGNGDGGGGTDVVFLASEFGGSSKKKKEDETSAQQVSAGSERRRALFAAQLAEILDECKRSGFDAPQIAFCVAPPDVNYVEVSAEAQRASSRKKSGAKAESSVNRRRLLERLAEQHTASFDQDRVAFVPLAPVAEQPRYVALVPEANEPVRPTLEALIAQERALPTTRLMDAELSTYARLARRMIPGDRPEQNTAVVRVGTEDTLILFFTGRELRHYERLRSLSTYDAPATICSRVLLQQDEQKIGEIQHILVLSEGRSEQLLDAFRQMFAEAAVETIQDALGALGVHPPRDTDGFSTGSVPAVAAALRLLQDWDQDDPDLAIHLLPKEMQRERKKLALTWHTVALMVVLVALAFFFSWRYMDQQAEIERLQEEMRLNPVEMPVDNPALLKARVDSLQTAYQKYTHALDIIDSLLVGSDRWTRLHEHITQSTRDVGGIWLTAMQPMGAGNIRIQGTATSRTRVAQFARRHQGSIEKASSFEIKHESRDIRLYDFVVTAPIPSETPRVALYLQDVSAGHIKDTAVDSVLAAYEAKSLYAPGHKPHDRDDDE